MRLLAGPGLAFIVVSDRARVAITVTVLQQQLLLLLLKRNQWQGFKDCLGIGGFDRKPQARSGQRARRGGGTHKI
jgi:hypothetical protein